MSDIDRIASQVKRNCNISDARFWGYYSPCGLLLRMRDLYRMEMELPPREPVDLKEIGNWMEGREALWGELEDREFQKIEIRGGKYNPFDVKGINAAIQNTGHVYGAGFGNLLKPLFILAELAETSSMGRFAVYTAGREKARDLSTSPAMIRGNTILLRQETMKMFFWSKFEEMRAAKCNGALFHAFSEYGIPADRGSGISPDGLDRLMTKITGEELSTYVHHEIGEASQRRVLGRWWKELLLQLPYSRAELFLRGLKDVLSDTCRSGMLAYIIENRKAGSLGFYIALLSGYRKILFPDILPAYEKFMEGKDWKCIENARVEGYKKAGDYVRSLKEMSDRGRVSAEEIEQKIVP